MDHQDQGQPRKRKFQAMEKLGPSLSLSVPTTTITNCHHQFNTNFCIKIAHHLMQKEIEINGSNFVFSPISFHLMLSFVTVGFRGRTLKQLLLFLEAKSIDDLNELSSRMVPLALPADGNDCEAPVLSFVNGAWVDHSFVFKPSFEKVVKGVYSATVQQVDFKSKAEEVRNDINLWATNETRGLIKSLLPPQSLDHDETAVVLANALYFKGAWAKKLDASKTKQKSFHLLNGKVVQVPFMTKNHEFEFHQYGYFPKDGYKILKLPYKAGLDTRNFSMYFFLPDALDGLQALIQKLESNPEILNKKFELHPEMIPDFWIPKFKFSYDFEASDVVTELGLDLPFQRPCELTEMIEILKPPFDPVELSKMFHKSCIEVDEEGSEAAACTAAIIQQLSCGYPISFVADHPFMFMIREDISGLVFFIGAVLNPLAVS